MKLRKNVKSAMAQLSIEKLRSKQRTAIYSVLDGQDTIVIAPTSYGKSLIAQIPAIIHHDKLTIIIEPLTALMHDQTAKLQELGIAAAYLDSTQSREKQQTVRTMLSEQKLTILYLAPERLAFESLPCEIYKNDIGMVVIDECHLVTAWGRTFREDYLHIGEFFDSLKTRPVVLAMTASAPPEDRADIMELLSMQNTKIITASLYRSNLHFIKQTCSSRREQQKALRKFMKKYHKHTTIVFCNTKKAAEAVAAYLNEPKLYHGEVMVYHSRNKHNERDMLSGQKKIIVATSALAMGVDIQNVDLVIHFNMPMSISDYYQMSGRAGRKKQKAHSILLYNSADYWTNQFMLEEIRDTSAQKTALERLDAMKELCENTEDCMYTEILDALGEKRKTVCRYCSNCQKSARNHSETKDGE